MRTFLTTCSSRTMKLLMIAELNTKISNKTFIHVGDVNIYGERNPNHTPQHFEQTTGVSVEVTKQCFAVSTQSTLKERGKRILGVAGVIGVLTAESSDTRCGVTLSGTTPSECSAFPASARIDPTFSSKILHIRTNQNTTVKPVKKMHKNNFEGL